MTIGIPSTAGKSLQADALYAYDVEITVHELFTTVPAETGQLEPRPQAVMVHVAALGPEDEAPPARLRARAIEPFRPEVA